MGKQIDPLEVNTLQNTSFRTAAHSSSGVTSAETVTNFKRARPLGLMVLQERRELLSSSEATVIWLYIFLFGSLCIHTR